MANPADSANVGSVHILIIPVEHFVTSRYPAGGIFQMHQATALRAAGHSVGVINPGVISPRFLFSGYPYRRHELVDGIPIYRRYARKLALQRFASPLDTVRTYEQLGMQLYEEYSVEHGRPDVVHAHDLLHSASVARAIGARDQVPYVLTEHSSAIADQGIAPKVLKATVTCVTSAGAVTAVSRFLGRRVSQALALPALTVHVLPNVLGAEFARSEIAPDTGAKPFTFLTVASLDDNKDQATLIAAFARTFRGSDVVLRIGGAGPLRRTLEAQSRQLGVERQVRFLGMLDPTSVQREMVKANCFVLSSRIETFGVVLIEALACGSPLIATRCGGPEDIVGDGNGQLVAPGDVHGLAAAMAGMVLDSSRYQRQQLRRDCLQRFGPEAYAANAVRFYQQALAAA